MARNFVHSMKPPTVQNGSSEYRPIILGDRMVGKTKTSIQVTSFLCTKSLQESNLAPSLPDFCYKCLTEAAGLGRSSALGTYDKQLIAYGEPVFSTAFDEPSCHDPCVIDLFKLELQQVLDSASAERRAIGTLLLDAAPAISLVSMLVTFSASCSRVNKYQYPILFMSIHYCTIPTWRP